MNEIWSLEDLSYPVTKDGLLEAAATANAGRDLIESLELLPNRSFGDADDLGRALRRSRATTNPGIVAINAVPCENCGFPVVPGKPHSCIEEKALFAESVQNVTDEFDSIDGGHGH